MALSKKKSKNIPKPTHFGKNLKFLRRLSGLNQTEMGAKLNLTRNHIASYESGLVEPNMKKFLTACKYFDIDPRQMLETILSERISEDIKVDEDKPIEKYVSEQMEEFVIQTNEMTKVFEGYKTFFSMRRDSETYARNKELHIILEDLLELLQSLIVSNWNLIQSVYPTHEENEKFKPRE